MCLYKESSCWVLWLCDLVKHWKCPRGCVIHRRPRSDEVCVYHLSLCVNILLGRGPSVSLGHGYFFTDPSTPPSTPFARLPTDHRVRAIFTVTEAQTPVRYCTQHDPPFSTARYRRGDWAEAASFWLAPAPSVCLGDRARLPKRLSRGLAYADGSRTKGWHVRLLSRWEGHFRRVKDPTDFLTGLLLILSAVTFVQILKSRQDGNILNSSLQHVQH